MQLLPSPSYRTHQMYKDTHVVSDTSVLQSCILPDFICELHSRFYDQRSVWMHGHTRLSFDHKSTRRQSGSRLREKNPASIIITFGEENPRSKVPLLMICICNDFKCISVFLQRIEMAQMSTHLLNEDCEMRLKALYH